MEAADDFVETMAWLSYLDECDEATRFNFDGLAKRWAARRREGLVGKPNPPRERRQDDDVSGTVTGDGEGTTTLVAYAPRMFEMKPRKFEDRMNNGAGNIPKNTRGVHGHRAVIQQPRKFY